MNDLVPINTTDAMKGLSLAQVKSQVVAINKLMKSVMQEKEHYGVIPGTNGKKVLFKAGAEKIGFMYRLAPSYEVKEIWDGDHLTVFVSCTLENMNTGQIWGQGVGMCSTKEAKYRYRAGEGESTGKQVPKAYWDNWKTDPAKAQELLGGKEFKAAKVDGVWMISKKGSQVEHPNPADFYNTVIKMGKKRAHVDAIITATAASDIFTQDIKDPEVEDGTG